MANKLKFLIHYICHQSDQLALSRTRLNKILLFIDISCFNRSGTTITNGKYIKKPDAPVFKGLTSALDELRQENKIAVKFTQTIYGDIRTEYISLVEPKISEFSPEQISLIDKVINEVCRKGAMKSISEKTHKFLGWILADVDEEIPIEAMILKQNVFDGRRMQWARESLGMVEN